MRIEKSMKNRLIIESILYIFMGYRFLYIPFVQIQMQIIGKVVVGSSTFFSLILMLVGLLCIFNIKMILNRKRNIFFYVIFLCICFWFVKSCICYKLSFYELGLIIFNRFLPFFIVYLIIIFNKQLPINRMLNFLVYASVINSFIVFLQYSKQDIIWPFESDQNGNQFFWSIYTYGLLSDSIRYPGLMTSALECSILNAAACVIVYKKRVNKQIKTTFFLLFFVISIITILLCKTRNVYVCVAFAILYLIISRCVPIHLKSIASTLLFLFFIIFYFSLINNGLNILGSAKGLFNNASSIERLKIWNLRINDFFNLHFLEQLFGAYYWQASSIRKYFFDSFYLEILFLFGLFGLFLIIFILLNLFTKFSVNKPFSSIMIGMLLVYGVANTPSYGVLGLFIIASSLLFYDQGITKKTNNERRLYENNVSCKLSI